jgi:hypothetical protein
MITGKVQRTARFWLILRDLLSLAAGLWEIAGIGEEKRARETPRSSVKPPAGRVRTVWPPVAT